LLSCYAYHRSLPSFPTRRSSDLLLMAQRQHVGAARRAVGREVPLPDASSLQLVQQLLAGGSTPSQRLDREELAGRVRQAVARLRSGEHTAELPAPNQLPRPLPLS